MSDIKVIDGYTRVSIECPYCDETFLASTKLDAPNETHVMCLHCESVMTLVFKSVDLRIEKI